MFLAAEYHSGTLRTQQQVSDAMGVPRRFVPQVLSDLVRSGLVVSAHGMHGGYRLARPPGQVRLLDVVEAGEGLLDSAVGFRGKGPLEPLEPREPREPREAAASHLQALMAEAGTRFRRVLAVTTLEHLVGRSDAAAPQRVSLPCGVLPTSPGAAVRVGGGLAALAVHEQVGEESVDGRCERIGAPASPQRRRCGGEEDDAVDHERDQ